MSGPQTEFSDNLHAEKYRIPGEDHRSAMNRLIGVLADNDDHREALKPILRDMRFMPAGRIQSAIGTPKAVTAMNCAVSGDIRDSFTQGYGNIMQRAAEAATTMRMGCGIGYDFSSLRPRGSWISGIKAQSSGPISFMEIYDAICRCTSSSGNRRGAQMGVLRIDHPDIMEFISAKHKPGALTGFNMSVGVTDHFMECLKRDEDFSLVFEGKLVSQIKATHLWEALMRSTWEHAEPGVLFVDTINTMNNLWYCEEIGATNPCGEQPLPPYGTCLLGSFNLVKYLWIKDARPSFDWVRFISDIPHVVRMMDNVVDNTLYPLPEQRDEAKAKRRMGLGITGAANAGEALGFPYGSRGFCVFLQQIMLKLTNEAYRSSAQLAGFKGSFPAYKQYEYLTGDFVSTLSIQTRDLIREFGIRNSHLISIAPTGTISLCADNVSSGIEPVFARTINRKIKEFDGDKVVQLEDYGIRELGVEPKIASDCTIEDHLNVMAAVVPYVDSAVSKTCVVPKTMPWEEFKNVYVRAHELGAKGITTFTDGGGREGILESVEDQPPVACTWDPSTGERSCE